MTRGQRIVTAGLAITLIAYAAWVSYPPSRHRKELDAICLAREAIFQQRQATYANDAGTNAYLDPTFREVWCVPSELATLHPGNVTTIVCGNTTTQSKQKLPSRKESVERREAFRKLLPALSAALSRPVFLAPALHYDASRELPNWSHLRSLGGRLGVDAVHSAREGKPEQALSDLLLALRLGRLFADGGALKELNVGISLQLLALNGLSGLLQNEVPASVRSGALSGIEREVLPPDALGAAAENQVLLSRNTLHRSGASVDAVVQLIEFGGFKEAAQPSASGVSRAVLGISGLFGREVRMFDNALFDDLQPAAQPPEPLSLGGDLSGKGGVIADVVDMPIAENRTALRLLRARLEALRIGAAIELYRDEHKVYPKTLDQLASVGLASWPTNDASPDPFQFESVDGKLHLIVPVDEGLAASAHLDPKHEDEWRYDGKALNAYLAL